MKKERTEKHQVKRRLECDLSDPEFNRPPKEGHGFIYRYTFNNGKCYIGQTVHKVSRRTRNHKYSKMLVDKIISSGAKFKVDILSEPRIAKFKTMEPNGYNQTSGGQRFATASEGFRKRASIRMKKKIEEDSDYKNKALKYLDKARIVAPKTPVICLETKTKYPTVAKATKAMGKNPLKSTIYDALKYEKQYKSYGYHWLPYTKFNMEHAEEYLKAMKDFEKEIYPIYHKDTLTNFKKMGGKYIKLTKAIHLETGKVYDSCKELADDIGINYNYVMDYMTGRRRTLYGQHVIRYEEWMDDARQEIIECLKDWEDTASKIAYNKRKRGCYKERKAIKILCLNTGKTFNSLNDVMNIESASITAIKDAIEKGTLCKNMYWIKYEAYYMDQREEMMKCFNEWRKEKKSFAAKRSNGKRMKRHYRLGENICKSHI